MIKLKDLPYEIVIHTPTDEEAKELLAILCESGCKWRVDKKTLWTEGKTEMCYKVRECERISYASKDYYEHLNYVILTLAEFKEKYCEEEKPQPKFEVGDKVKIVNVRNPMMLNEIGIIEEHSTKDSSIYKVKWDEDLSTFIEDVYLEPYIEPETKPTEDMETKGKESEETFASEELNLCKLLKESKNEEFYSPIYGNIKLQSIMDCEYPLRFYNGAAFSEDGRHKIGVGKCMLFPSLALFEKYPLDAKRAWMKWQEEQKKHWVSVTAWIDDLECESDTTIDTPKIYFRTTADRDKCIEEIKAIIEKYNK